MDGGKGGGGEVRNGWISCTKTTSIFYSVWGVFTSACLVELRGKKKEKKKKEKSTGSRLFNM